MKPLTDTPLPFSCTEFVDIKHQKAPLELLFAISEAMLHPA